MAWAMSSCVWCVALRKSLSVATRATGTSVTGMPVASRLGSSSAAAVVPFLGFLGFLGIGLFRVAFRAWRPQSLRQRSPKARWYMLSSEYATEAIFGVVA